MMTIVYKEIEWLKKQGALVAHVPPHITIMLTKKDKDTLLALSGAYFLRWNSQYDIDKSQFWYIAKDTFEDVNMLSKNTRSKLRRGFKRSYVAILDVKKCLDEIYYVYQTTSVQYDTFEAVQSKDEFAYYLSRLMENKYQFFGIFDRESNRLVGYSQNFIKEDTCFYEEIFYDPAYLKNYIGYVLIHEMNKYYLLENKFQYVHDGSRNLSHSTQIHHFLINTFSFKKVYTRMEICYRKDIKYLVIVLYPFRRLFEMVTFNFFKKLVILLKHEEIIRSYD